MLLQNSKVKNKQLQVDKSLIHVDPGTIIKLLGEQEDRVDSHTLELVNIQIDMCRTISSPAGTFVVIEAEELSSVDEISLGGIRFNTGKIIGKMLQNATSYALFLVTAGPEPENLAKLLLNQMDFVLIIANIEIKLTEYVFFS